VAFADCNLEAAVREAIGKPTGPIYPSDLDGMTSLGVLSKNITDISGLEYATSLTSLRLSGNQISDSSPLANLTNLDYVSVEFSQIRDMEPLVNNLGLSAGEEVYLTANPLSAASIDTHIPGLEARGVIVYR
jgi:Leucine-rich repeat (LRR) protein